MIKNFEIADAVGILLDGQYFDLHNEFKITLLNKQGNTFSINLAHIDEVKTILIVISFFDLEYLDSDTFPLVEGEVFISEIGYKAPDDSDHDWLLGENLCQPDSHLFFRFDSDKFLRIYARRAVAALEAV